MIRNLAIWVSGVINGVMAFFGYIPAKDALEIARIKLYHARIQNGTDAVARGQRWESFNNEEGGLRDMFTSLRRDYFEKVGQLAPGDTESLKALAMADRICREVERKVQTVIETGHIRANEQAHVNKIASIRR